MLTLATQYTVSLNADQNANPGGTITLLTALAVGSTLVITSSLSFLQAADLTNQGGFYPRVITDALDRLTIFAQQLGGKISAALRAPISDGAVDLTLPNALSRGLKVLAFNSAGQPIASNLTLESIESGSVDASASAVSSAESAQLSLDYLTAFRGTYYGPATSDPALDPNGVAPTAGDLYLNTASGKLRVYTTVWVDAVTAAPVSFAQQLFSGTGAQTAFVLSVPPASSTSILVFVAGSRLRLTTDYTLSGSTVTFVVAPASGTNNIAVVSFLPVNVGVPDDASVSAAKIQTGAVTPVKLSTGGPSWDAAGNFTLGAGVGNSHTVNGGLTTTGNIVANNKDITAGLNFFAGNGNTGYGIFLYYIAANNYAKIQSAAAGEIQFQNGVGGPATKLQIDSSGNFSRVIPGGTTLYADISVISGGYSYSNLTSSFSFGAQVAGYTRPAVGTYVIDYFSFAMPDLRTVGINVTPADGIGFARITARTATSFTVVTSSAVNGAGVDGNFNWSIFR